MYRPAGGPNQIGNSQAVLKRGFISSLNMSLVNLVREEGRPRSSAPQSRDNCHNCQKHVRKNPNYLEGVMQNMRHKSGFYLFCNYINIALFLIERNL
jgi:hypothetical protein